MAAIGVFTIASRNYLAHVRLLMRSLAITHPEYRLFLCLADRVDGRFDVASEPFTVVRADELEIPNFRDMTIRYDVMELNTAVKPFMFQWLFSRTALDAIIFLDPDIRAYSRFDEVEAALASGASVVLTPHLTEPLEDGKYPGDDTMMRTGVFNLGFMAARRCDETTRFLHWWGEHLRASCLVDPKASLFVDQKWCDLAPCFLDRLHILKHPGYNVAYWNLAQRRVVPDADGRWRVNGEPLAFFHFSGISVDDRSTISRYQNRFSWDDVGPARLLFDAYVEELLACGWRETSQWPYAYDRASPEFPLSPMLRYFYRTVVPRPVEVPDGDIEQYLIALCNQPSDAGAPGAAPISRLLREVYRRRPDIQAAFSLNTPGDRQGLIDWFSAAGARDYGLPPAVTQYDPIDGRRASNGWLASRSRRWGGRVLSRLRSPIRTLSRILPDSLRRRGKRWWFRMERVSASRHAPRARS